MESGVTPEDLPVVITAGAVLRRPTPGSLAEYLGLTLGTSPSALFRPRRRGRRPAGLAAAVYGASEGLRDAWLRHDLRGRPGGTSSRIENYFGFPTAYPGSDLTQRAWSRQRSSAPTSSTRAPRFRSERSTATSGRALRRDRRRGPGRHRRHRCALPTPRRPDSSTSSKPTASTTRPPTWRPASAPGRPSLLWEVETRRVRRPLFLADTGRESRRYPRPDLAASMSRYLVDRLEATTGRDPGAVPRRRARR